jgi:hypothetical protein
LSRIFRYYEKKRGHRRTGSSKWGSVGEAAFWAALVVSGTLGSFFVVTQLVVPEWRVNNEFVETPCKVIEKRVAKQITEDGPVYRPDVKIEYEVNGVTHRDWHYDIHRSYTDGEADAQAACDDFALYDPDKDNRYLCWYDPMNPDTAVLVQGYRWWIWLVLTVPLSFVVIGSGGLIYTLFHWGRSAERRAAIAKRVQERDFFSRNNDRPAFPSIPQGIDTMNSPGTRMRFRLPMAVSPGWALFGTLGVCIFWNGIVSFFVWLAIEGHLEKKPDWFLTVFIIPFVLVGIALIFLFVRRLLVIAGVGPTLLEISSHPLQPGGDYRIFLSQSGRLAFHSLRVSLLCEESATYRQGTNTRKETQEVYREEIFRREAFSIERGLPFETEMMLSVPPNVMHSFKSRHNEINWILAVEGDVVRWPDFKRRFSVIVRPNVSEDDR